MMLRRTFSKLFSSAAVALVVGVEHFHPVRASVDVELQGADWEPTERESQQYSVVLQGLRRWNDARSEAQRTYGVAGTELFWELPQETNFRIATNKISARAVSALEMSRREMNAKIKG